VARASAATGDPAALSRASQPGPRHSSARSPGIEAGPGDTTASRQRRPTRMRHVAPGGGWSAQGPCCSFPGGLQANPCVTITREARTSARCCDARRIPDVPCSPPDPGPATPLRCRPWSALPGPHPTWLGGKWGQGGGQGGPGRPRAAASNVPSRPASCSHETAGMGAEDSLVQPAALKLA
jgi:hypothetical protein